MSFKVNTHGGHAIVNEWHNECVTILDREIGGSLSGREESWRATYLNATKLMTWLTATRDNFKWKPDSTRVQKQVSIIQSGKPIDASVMYSVDDTGDSLVILDGRHRIAALHQLGANDIPIMVPVSQEQLFKDNFG